MPKRPPVNFKPEEWVKIDDLKEHPKNPRVDLKSNKKQFEKLKESILEGVFEPIKVSRRSGYCIAGNQRLKAFKDLGFEEVPVQYNDYESEADEMRDMIKDNNEWGAYDYTILNENITDVDLDIDSLGFNDADLHALDQEIKNQMRDEKEDDVPELPEEPVSKLGDIYQLGSHRLMCGDSINPEDVAKLMNGKQSDMIHTDPPYNVNYDGKVRFWKNKEPTRKVRNIKGDNQSPEEWEAFCHAFITVMKKVNKGDIYVWGASGPDGMRMRLWMIENGAHWSSTIIWKKHQMVLSPSKYQRMYEPCFYGWFGQSTYRADRKQVEVWEVERPKKSELHPTMKPVELCVRAIENSSIAGDVVLDLFGGSGSTLIACEKLKRKCYMMELDPRYVDVIVKRWEEYTGLKAKKI